MIFEKLKNLDRKSRIIIMIIYAVLMFISIQLKIGLLIFILLFAVLPISIYLYVKKIFPRD